MLVLPAKLTHREAPDAVRMLAQSLNSELSGKGLAASTPVVIDALALQQFDSSALAVLLECRRLASAQGRSVKLLHAPTKLSQLARLYGLDDLLGIAAAKSPAQGVSV